MELPPEVMKRLYQLKALQSEKDVVRAPSPGRGQCSAGAVRREDAWCGEAEDATLSSCRAVVNNISLA